MPVPTTRSRGGLRRPGRPLLVALGLLACGWWVTELRPFTWPSLLAVETAGMIAVTSGTVLRSRADRPSAATQLAGIWRPNPSSTARLPENAGHRKPRRRDLSAQLLRHRTRRTRATVGGGVPRRATAAEVSAGPAVDPEAPPGAGRQTWLAGLGIWLVLLVLLAGWELAAYLQHPRDDHPTLSSLIDGILAHRPLRVVAFAGWLAGAHRLARR